MQPLKDEEVVTLVLQRVILGELTPQEMGKEFKRLKIIATIQRAFLNSVNKKTWKECKTTYPKHCTDATLVNIVPIFIGWVGFLSSRLFYLFVNCLFLI
jgi:hypothetical protein